MNTTTSISLQIKTTRGSVKLSFSLTSTVADVIAATVKHFGFIDDDFVLKSPRDGTQLRPQAPLHKLGLDDCAELNLMKKPVGGV